MPRKRSGDIPPLKPHKSGQGRVRFREPFRGKTDHYLGKWGTRAEQPETWAAYDRLIREWLAASRGTLPAAPAPGRVSVNQVLARHWLYVTSRQSPYWKLGRPTSQVDRIRRAHEELSRRFGTVPAEEIGPKSLKALRAELVIREHDCPRCRGAGQITLRRPPGRPRKGTPARRAVCPSCAGAGRKRWSTRYVNCLVGCLKTAFAWAAEEELIPGAVAMGLRVVKNLPMSHQERHRVKPVPWEQVEATIAQAHPILRDMILVQYLADMRPLEVCALKPRLILVDGQVTGGPCFPGLWVYEADEQGNKLHHKGKPRVVLFGAKAQAVLEPYLKSRGPDDYLFSPAEARAAWMRAAGRKVEPPADRAPGPYYTTAAYRAAIHNACARAGVPPWNPNQLRHLRNTELRKQFGLPVASSLSGHESLETTLIYAEEDLEAAAEAVRRIG